MPPPNPDEPLQQRGERLYQVTTQIGCGIRRFEKTGRAQLESLIRNGLNPWDKLLDIGCGARFLTSFKPPHLFRPDYKGDIWIGRSHESDQAGICRHSYKWIQQACESRGLTVKLLKGEKIHKQKWILIHR